MPGLRLTDAASLTAEALDGYAVGYDRGIVLLFVRDAATVAAQPTARPSVVTSVLARLPQMVIEIRRSAVGESLVRERRYPHER